MAIPTKTFETVLVEEGLLNKEQLEQTLKQAAEENVSLGAAAGKLGFCTEDAVAKVMAAYRGTKFVDVSTLKQEIMDQLAKLVPSDLVNRYKAIPVGKKFDKYTFAVIDPVAPMLIRLSDELFRGKRGEIEFWVSTETAIDGALEKYFPAGKKAQAASKAAATPSAGSGLADVMSDMGAIKVAEGPDGAMPEAPDLEVVDDVVDAETEAVDQAPIIQLINRIIFEAVEKKASDIHIDPTETGMILRYRLDGVLHDIATIPKQWKQALVAVVKVKTRKMKIEEKRIPQDAKIKIKVPSRDKPIDLRVSTLPVVNGEKIVMRILDSSQLYKLEELGMEDDELDKLKRAIDAPQGMTLVTGPTGSGKTNTLYSALNTVNDRAYNIMTAENPVEFQLPGINQVQIVEEQGMTFAAALKAFLRQDPDIILVGEVRDFSEAEIAVKAAMTGHLVLTTMHTNDAPSAISRLMDMRDTVSGQSMDPGILASSVNLVLAQRLMRTICKKCKEPVTYTKEQFAELGLDPAEFEGVTLYKGKGCPACSKTGYKGRIGIYEAMIMSRALRDLVMARKDANTLRDVAIKEGMRTLRQSAILKAKNGHSTLEQIIESTID
jgi:type IV pilus assembly protein PilB